MSQQPAVRDAVWYKADGTRVAEHESLVAGQTYYAELGGHDGMWSSVQYKWDAAIIVTITHESSNLDVEDPAPLPAAVNFWRGVRVWEAAAVGWHLETDPLLTVTVAGGAAGNQLVHIGGSGAKRMRAKAVVGGTGGAVRSRPHHKS